MVNGKKNESYDKVKVLIKYINEIDMPTYSFYYIYF